MIHVLRIPYQWASREVDSVDRMIGSKTANFEAYLQLGRRRWSNDRARPNDHSSVLTASAAPTVVFPFPPGQPVPNSTQVDAAFQFGLPGVWLEVCLWKKIHEDGGHTCEVPPTATLSLVGAVWSWALTNKLNWRNGWLQMHYQRMPFEQWKRHC